MSDSIERIIADLRRWGVDGAEEIADRLAALPAVAAPIATEQPAQRGTPAAWLVTGGKTFEDRTFISEAQARESADARKDGAKVVPLYLAPASDKQGDGLLDEVEALAHRTAWRYKKSSDTHHSDTYTFNRFALLHFAEKLRALDTSAKGDGLREAVRSVLASMYATSPSQLDEYNIHVEGWIETLQRALDTSERKDGSNG